MRKNDDIIAIYSRKSKFTGKGESIGNQVELCKEYVRVHYGDAAVDKVVVYEDEGFSGGNLNRPDFKKMMDAAKKRKFKAIIVYRLDRISRNISDFASLIEELARLDISFVSIKEQFDTSTPMGRAMMYIASVFSQLERETIAERIRDNMHELAKTGRWLGGTTPTGYASEAVKSITIDGKSKKACKLKLIPDEADIVRMIYDLYVETDSLTLTEAALIKQGIKTKNNNYFTRFSIKAILQNPVYMIADEDAYNFFIQNDTDLFSEKDAFDNQHGIMAYNRTDQEKGRATKYLPASEWIVSVGKHPGLIPGKVWVQIQESLERNKSKSFRKPRSNEALLTGLLFCSCGERMYPKMSKRKTADDKVIYTYVCKMKERSQRSVCNSKNANGNTLDMAVVEQIKMLAEDKDTFIARLEQSRRFYTGNRMDYEQRLDDMRKEKIETEKKINSLVDSLVDMGDSPAKAHVTKRIEQLNGEYLSLEQRIQELEGLTSQHALSDVEFDLLRQLLTIFKDGIDEMTVEQKRAAIRTIVRKVVWDGVNAHVILFGVRDDEIEYPEIAAVASDNTEDDEETEELVDFSDVDYEDDDMEDERLGKTNPLSASKTHWGEDSKYCYNSKQRARKNEQTLSEHIAKAGIDYFFSTNQSRHIRFYGPGEPTQEFDLLKNIVEYARQKAGSKLSTEIQTNGCFNKNVCKWILDNINIVWISFDGTPEIHDRNRHYENDVPSSPTIERNVKWLIENKCNRNIMVGARVTITDANVNKQKEIIDYFYSLGITNIWTDPIFPSVDEIPVFQDEEKKKQFHFDMDKYVDNYIEAYYYGKSISVFYGSFLACNFDGVCNTHCRACTPTPHFTSDGYVSACDLVTFGNAPHHMECFVYGKWDEAANEFKFDHNKIKRLQLRTTENIAHCRDCSVKEHCGGYCLGEVMNETGKLDGRKEIACYGVKKLFSAIGNEIYAYRYFHP